MMQHETGVFSNSLIWFGAGVSIAEILTGTLLAPLGFSLGLTAILLGHLLGCFLFYLTGFIGAKTQKSAMESIKISFGQKGSMLFASLNVIQLIGWTAVMIVGGSVSANLIINFGGTWAWSLVIASLIVLWIFIGIKNLKTINTIAMFGLFTLTIVLSILIFKSNTPYTNTDTLSFGAAVELSAIMPLSWLPLVSDYTRFAKSPKLTSFVSAGVYFLVSSWMYVIGLGVALYAGNNDIAQIMLLANLGILGLFIVVLSTTTTTFLDTYSAGVSFTSIFKNVDEKHAAIAICLLGCLIAIFVPTSRYESFLYFIASVFAPMIAILLTDFYIVKKDSSSLKIDTTNIIIWALGFGIYRYFLSLDTPLGNTIPTMIIVSILTIVINKFYANKSV